MLKTRGVAAVAAAAGRRVLGRTQKSFAAVRPAVAGKHGLEIGGPSDLFARHGGFPVYAIAARIDNCNFSAQTVWAGAAPEGITFRYDAHHSPGRQYIVEATDLSPIPSAGYDFVLSAHTLEHVANPLRALKEWSRTMKDDGVVVLVLPHKEGTFDHRRPVSTLAHLVEDFERNTPESDVTHVPEILALHDLSRDPPAGDFDAFKARSERNVENRCLHHHVFDTRLAVQAVDWAGLQILAVEPTRPYHIFVVARKVPGSQPARNQAFLSDAAEYRTHSPFQRDRE